ncbi:MAG: DUF1874 domain-containing protein [Chloroflexi bacterium]|nr:DUF1874 domain-containing protein [Chloroflexota bacterium]
MTTYLGNALSLNMFDIGADGLQIDIRPILPAEIPADAISIIGHEDMAALVARVLGRVVYVNRESVTLTQGDILFVAQYRGPRLAAGETQLPSGAKLEFYRVTTKRSS